MFPTSPTLSTLPRSQSLPNVFPEEEKPLTIYECADRLGRIVKFDPSQDLVTLVDKVKWTLQIYASNIFDNDLEVKIDEDNLEVINEHVSRGKREITAIQITTEDLKHLFQGLTDCQNCLNSLLLDHAEEKGWLESFFGLFQQSTKLQEIKWKFKKYESLILSVSSFMETIPSDPVKTIRDQLKLPEEYEKMMASNNSTRFTLKNLNSLRTLYSYNFIEQLRNQLKIAPNDSGLLELCYKLYCNISLDEDNRSILDLFERWGEKCLKERKIESKFMNDEVRMIDAVHRKIHAVPNTAKAPTMAIIANSMRGIFSRDFDPNIQGNPIHRLYSIQIRGKCVHSLGFGSPTIEEFTLTNSAKLNPEFKAFLRYCKNNNKRHLFITNQDATADGKIQAEKQRCDLLIMLQDEEEYRGSFYAIALSKNSLFYTQKDIEYPSSKAFLDDLLGQFIDAESGCIIPKKMMDVVSADLPMIAAAIHEKLFNRCDNLSREERLIFIEVFYDELTKWLILKFDIDTYNISCKDAIDRGAASNAQLYSHLAISNDALDEEHLKRTQVLMMVRALLVRKRAPLRERVTRFLYSLDFNLNHASEIKALHNELFGKETFIPIKPFSFVGMERYFYIS